jgi:Helix-turn-helix domain
MTDTTATDAVPATTQVASKSHASRKPFHVGEGRYGGISEHWLATIRGSALSVYMALAVHADRDTGECFPAKKTIEELCGVKGEDNIRLALRKLERIHALRITRREGKASLYHLLPPSPKIREG